jgi:hypothetical protein
MRNRLLAVFCLSLVASCASVVQTSPHALADAICTVTGNPTPPPQGAYKITIATCDNAGHLMVSASGVATPIPYPTNTAGVILVQPTNVPTIGVNVVNTSIPVTAATTIPVAGFHNTSGLTQAVACDQSAPVDSTTTGTTVVSLIPITFGLTTYICGFYLNTSVSAGATVQLEYGVHIAGPCDVGPSAISGPIHVVAGTNYQMGAGTGSAFAPGATREFCMVVTGTGTSIQGFVTFSKF